MDRAWQCITVRWKLLLCLAALLGLASFLVFLPSASRSPFRAFVMKTNGVPEERWWHMVITNTSLKRYTITPHVEVMLGGAWKTSSVQRFEWRKGESADIPGNGSFMYGMVPFGRGGTSVDIPERGSLLYDFTVPPESARWRVKLLCVRHPNIWEIRLEQWWGKVGLKYPFRSDSEDSFEFGK
jgi:hypothetical protein